MTVPQRRRLTSDSSSESWYSEDEGRSHAAKARWGVIAMDLAGRSHTSDRVLSHYLRFSSRTPEEADWLLTCQHRLCNSERVNQALQTLRDSDAQYQEDQKWWETEMCFSLEQLFDEIGSHCDARRKFYNTHSPHTTIEDPLIPCSSHVQPDFALRDLQHLNPQTACNMPWHTVLACVKVKCSHSDAPHPDLGEESSPAKDIVAQAGDYSRIHLAHRPFQLFSISLLIYGPSFNISVYDRGGVLHSPRRDIYDDNGLTADFVFVVKRLLQDLSPVELGREPGVELHGPEIEDGTANDSLSYPRFRVPALPAQPTYFAGYWTTDGRPIWTSYSLVGRGTVVWKATADPDTSNRAYVLKSAWRRACRPSEVAVYEYLRERRLTGARGIADFLAGDNVALRRADGTTAPLSINALRPADAHVEPDMVLHRVLLPSVGTPLWLFEDPAHFVRALLAVVKGIEALAEHGILHRDISIGNVLLSADPRAGHEAFLTDFEFASIREWDDAGAVDDSQGVKQESHMTSTLQFMAIDLLYIELARYESDCGAARQSDNSRSPFLAGSSALGLPLQKHEVKHDLESLIWVADCALYRRAFQAVAQRPDTDAERIKVEEALRQQYGPPTVAEIFAVRSSTLQQIVMAPPPGFTRPVDHVLRFIEPPLASVRTVLLYLVWEQNRKWELSDSVAGVILRGAGAIGVDGPASHPGQPITCAALEHALQLALQHCCVAVEHA